MRQLILFFTLVLAFVACKQEPTAPKPSELLTKTEDPTKSDSIAAKIRNETTVKLADGLEISLWASDSLSPDPVSIAIDDLGRAYITRTVRQKHSEFDIRGHQDWMTESISWQTMEERRAFLRRNFAPERSKQNEWLADLNNDGSHDWKDLAIEKDEIWRLEDTNNDGFADKSVRVFADFFEEVTDVAGGLLVRAKDAFYAQAPYFWRLEDQDGDGIWEKKTATSKGYAVHVGFSGHNMSGPVEGPDGRIYFNMGDIGANITTTDGRKIENANSGFIARCNPDGSDFEIFATGLRNTHEFVFDDYGNLISEDNDGDYPGESERLVHVVEGSDAGWRSNWQYGKYTDPKNNRYNVWMDEKLSVPHWEGQAAYIIPPIMNYHNGPTGMVYNPGTALGKEWLNKFFVVEFVGTTSNSHIWSFGLKPKGASFELDGEKDMMSGILPTGIQFGPDGALYVADWITGWETKNYGRVWKLDVTKEKNNLEKERAETKRLMTLDYSKQTGADLGKWLGYADRRIRMKAQFELASRGKDGAAEFNKAIKQTENQLARIHGIWGMGQLLRSDAKYAAELIPLLKDKDEEIIVQSLKMLGDSEVKSIGNDIIPFLKSTNPRLQFYAAECLGQIKHEAALQPLIDLIRANNDKDLYIRHAAVLALSRIGKADPILALSSDPSKAVRTAAVLILRKLKDERINIFLDDKDQYVATEAARAINDDHSIPGALPALAATLRMKNPASEALLRRAINAAVRVGSDAELDLLFNFTKRTDLSEAIRIEALDALGTWAAPSLLDRVDGRFRGKVTRSAGPVQRKVKEYVAEYLKDKNPKILAAVANMLVNLDLKSSNDQLAAVYASTQSVEVKAAFLEALSDLKYAKSSELIKQALGDKEEKMRTTALGLLTDATVTQQSLPELVNIVFNKGTPKEQQRLLQTMTKLEDAKVQPVLQGLLVLFQGGKLSPNLSLELKEAIDSSGSANLVAMFDASYKKDDPLAKYTAALEGGDGGSGYGIFNWNSKAQCVRCHKVDGNGGEVGPDLTHIGKTLTREQILQAIVDPSARLAPGFGNVVLKLKDGQEVFGSLMKESDKELTLKTNNAEPLVVEVSRIEKRENLPSGMPPMGETLTMREIRDLVEYLVGKK
ncbi:MAG: HEAT repeat domain-containing protein [Saprospiraceae bacterium]|nr:HEAT repeat domain-containing protein [Saprospiraceae bacterium]